MDGKKFVLKSRPIGEPKLSDFELIEEELPPVKDGEFAVESLYLTVDPYMRYLSSKMRTGTIMPGQNIARVVESKHPDFKVGDKVIAYYGWQSKVVLNPNVALFAELFPSGAPQKPTVIPTFEGLPASLALGILGMPGITALFGFLELTKPKAGETLVVSGAAGAVGSVVGQLGKILGLKVIGFAGTDEKIDWLKKDLKFDFAFNYKTKNVTEAIKEAAPEGVDVYFDNVGGQTTYEVLHQMNTYGRVSCCGAISSYNSLGDPTTPLMTPSIEMVIIWKQLSLFGFLSTRWEKKWQDGVKQLLEYVLQGKLLYKETVTDGFENMPKAFIEMLRGANIGKAIVKV